MEYIYEAQRMDNGEYITGGLIYPTKGFAYIATMENVGNMVIDESNEGNVSNLKLIRVMEKSIQLIDSGCNQKIYYLIQAYSKEIDNKYHTHLYPTYLTSYNLSLGGNEFGLQSGFTDALKFTSKTIANQWKTKAEEIFGEINEFEIVSIDSRIFGRVDLRYVVGK